jgi:hypothetical protein
MMTSRSSGYAGTKPVGMSSRLRKAFVAAMSFGPFYNQLIRARHSEATAACSSVFNRSVLARPTTPAVGALIITIVRVG